MHGRGAGVGPEPIRHFQFYAYGPGLRIEIGWPLPDCDGQVDAVLLGGNPHHFRAAPSHGPDIAIGDVILEDGFPAGCIYLVGAVGNFKVQYTA